MLLTENVIDLDVVEERLAMTAYGEEEVQQHSL